MAKTQVKKKEPAKAIVREIKSDLKVTQISDKQKRDNLEQEIEQVENTRLASSLSNTPSKAPILQQSNQVQEGIREIRELPQEKTEGRTPMYATRRTATDYATAGGVAPQGVVYEDPMAAAAARRTPERTTPLIKQAPESRGPLQSQSQFSEIDQLRGTSPQVAERSREIERDEKYALRDDSGGLREKRRRDWVL